YCAWAGQASEEQRDLGALVHGGAGRGILRPHDATGQVALGVDLETEALQLRGRRVERLADEVRHLHRLRTLADVNGHRGTVRRFGAGGWVGADDLARGDGGAEVVGARDGETEVGQLL